MGNSKKRLVMVSLDAVGTRDMDQLLTLPNFSKLVAEGAFCKNVTSVYPSLTYPAHATILTGRVPDHHGIVSNTKLQPNRDNPDWLYQRKYIHGVTLTDLAKKDGMRVASLLWPVTGGARIDYNLPEVMVTRKHQSQVLSCIVNGSPKYLLELNSKFGSMRKGIAQPELDDFVMASVRYTIEQYDPDMLLIHLTDTDTTRHNFGAVNAEVTASLQRHDERLGKLLSWLEETRPMEDTTLVVLGDHCQIDSHTVVYLNKYLADRGFIDIENGTIKDYRLISQSCDGSAYIYLNPVYRDDAKLLSRAADVLNEMKKDERLGIEEIFSSEEAAGMGADSRCLAMVEGKRGYYFLNQFETLTESAADTKNHKMLAIHGCLPTKEENHTFFVAAGRGVRKGARVENMNLTDEGPTIAHLMGWELPGADGRIVEEIPEQ